MMRRLFRPVEPARKIAMRALWGRVLRQDFFNLRATRAFNLLRTHAARRESVITTPPATAAFAALAPRARRTRAASPGPRADGNLFHENTYANENVPAATRFGQRASRRGSASGKVRLIFPQPLTTPASTMMMAVAPTREATAGRRRRRGYDKLNVRRPHDRCDRT
jgi:hypothetical protein